MTLEEVFAERQYAERFLTSVYFNLPEELGFHQWYHRNPFVGASDDMEITWSGAFGNTMNTGAWNPNNIDNNIWNFNWEGLRKANIFLEQIPNTPMDEAAKQRWIGEATFLRAFFHFLLARTHGAIPIVDRAYTQDEDFGIIKQRPIDEVAQFIAAECDVAASLLPDRITKDQLGRPCKSSALALKSRVLLYWASPLWNGNPDYKSFVNVDGENLYSGTADPARWTVAANAAEEAITTAEAAGYKLYQENADPVANYHDIFMKNYNSEVLFARNMGAYKESEGASTPNGMGGYGGYCPTQELVDAYEMENGETPIVGYEAGGKPIINERSGYVETGYATQDHPKGWYLTDTRNMYARREPRFYASIHFSGAYWRTRRIEFWNSGRDGRGGNAVDHSVTGYLVRKFSDEDVNIPQNIYTNKTWIYFRLGELYLNHAEALNEAEGPTGMVYSRVNAIRNRAGLPNLPTGLSQDQMREKIRHERRIELAMETHRYFDTRRWKIAAETDGGDFYRMSIDKGNSLTDDAFYVRTFMKKRVFDKQKHYLWPIPQGELNKTPSLVQNPGW
ncbi:RagB/SusD family nutrient uptake outer membrane protein [Olivibacter ginsenosidimutans]|uniref:RagB/SusD family nutrient uptake outer membrane protein n=2 Tax=Olivibacter ginsenosidimutans TaxID=1176537 RepID=A0ABP9AF62_9SPHI